jgi:multicomponent K+:H+ antiporter subunit F
MNLLAAVLPWAASAFAIALLLSGWRLLRGPTLADRMLALDSLYVNSVALLILIGMYFDTDLYFEAALIIAMMGFVSTVALAKYLLRGDIIE